VLIHTSVTLMGHTNEMTWRCQSEAIAKVPNGVKSSKPLPLGVFNKVEKEQNEANVQRDQVSTWHSIVEDYTRRELSERLDYERGISGIASELAICWNDEYLTGLWRRTFVPNLAWRVEKDMLWYFEQSYIKGGRYPPLEGPSWSWLSKLAKVSFFRITDIKLKLVDDQLRHSNFADGSLIVRAAYYEFGNSCGDWRRDQYWFTYNSYMDDNSEFSPWSKKDSETLGLLLGFSGTRAIGIIVERIAKQETKYRRRGLWENAATPVEHTRMWDLSNDNAGHSFKEVIII